MPRHVEFGRDFLHFHFFLRLLVHRLSKLGIRRTVQRLKDHAVVIVGFVRILFGLLVLFRDLSRLDELLEL